MNECIAFVLRIEKATHVGEVAWFSNNYFDDDGFEHFVFSPYLHMALFETDPIALAEIQKSQGGEVIEVRIQEISKRGA